MHLDRWTILLQTINFAILVWLLHRFLYKPVLGMIDARKAEIQRQYDMAKAAEDKASATLAAIESARNSIAAERDATLKAAAAKAQEAAETRRAQAERETQALLDATRKTLAAEREHALAETRQVALDLCASFARRLIAEIPVALRAEAWMDRMGQHLDALPPPARAALAVQIAQGGTLKVVTAVPLPPETAEAWRVRLWHALGENAAITFEVNPDLVAGADLHFPTSILSFSWQSRLAAMRSEVSGHGNAL